MGASSAEKKYNLSLELSVVFPIGSDFPESKVKDLVRRADAVSPWETSYNDGTPADSIRWMSNVEVREGFGIDRLYKVTLQPPFLHTFDQARAYERYGNQLARNVAALLVSSKAIGVKSRLILDGTFGELHRPPR